MIGHMILSKTHIFERVKSEISWHFVLCSLPLIVWALIELKKKFVGKMVNTKILSLSLSLSLHLHILLSIL